MSYIPVLFVMAQKAMASVSEPTVYYLQITNNNKWFKNFDKRVHWNDNIQSVGKSQH